MARGLITSEFIDVTGDLHELNELFNGYWRRVVPLGQTSSIAFPFSRLHNEPFWKLVPVQSKEITPAILNNITTVSQLRTVALGAVMDKELTALLQQPECRMALRQALLQSCFSAEIQRSLGEQAEINAKAYDYSQDLERRAHLHLVQEAIEADKYQPAVREQGFRRIVVTSYDHRCALCGVRIVTSEGYSVVDAAHIIPWSGAKMTTSGMAWPSASCVIGPSIEG